MAEAARPQRRDPALAWLVVALLLLAAGAWFLWNTDTRRGSLGAEYSIHRTDDRGTAVFFELYRRAGLQPRVWDRSFEGLREPGLLFLVAPERVRLLLGAIPVGTEGDILPDEIGALDRWVRGGGTLVVFASETNHVYHALGLQARNPGSSTPGTAEPMQPGVLTQGVGRLRTAVPTGFIFGRKKQLPPDEDSPAAATLAYTEPPFPPIPAAEWTVLFSRSDGARRVPQVVAATRGAGICIAVIDPDVAGNVGIAGDDNARFLLNLASLRPEGGAVWFDEFHKRAVDRGFVSYLRARNMGPLAIYLLLLIGLALWRGAVRFGDPVPRIGDPRPESIEYVRAVAQFYQSAKLAREALDVTFADFRRRLAGALRLDGLADLSEVARRYEARTGRAGQEAREVLIRVEAALAAPALDEAKAVELCARLARLDQDLHRPARDRGA